MTALLTSILMLVIVASAVAEVEYKAIAVIRGNHTNHVCGTVTFEEEDGTVSIKGSLSGLMPAGNHGFHIHQFGDCSSEDFTSAGPHFNPDEKEHAGPGDEDRHAGDLGNIVADDQGNATITKVDLLVRVKPGKSRSIIGRAVIVHQGEDDLGKGGDDESKKTGNAGKRLACGVIGIAKL